MNQLTSADEFTGAHMPHDAEHRAMPWYRSFSQGETAHIVALKGVMDSTGRWILCAGQEGDVIFVSHGDPSIPATWEVTNVKRWLPLASVLASDPRFAKTGLGGCA